MVKLIKLIKLGEVLPSINFEMTDGKIHTFSDFKGRKLVLYFYPKDNTSGCTLEAQGFRDLIPEFSKKNSVILGVSKDSLKSHESFREKHCLPFDLIMDTKENGLCELFDVWKEKSMYGKKYWGIERSTFLIDENGKLIKEWRKVSVPGHVEEVLVSIA
jgi:peroxiredoxin Q/BCP